MNDTMLMTIDAKRADQKFLMSNAVLQRAVNINIAALMTTLKSPKVNNTAGRVSNFRKDPMKLLIKPNNNATQRYFQAPP